MAALQGGVMTIIITLCFSVLALGGRKGRRKGAFTAMFDTRTLGVGGTGIGTAVEVGWGARELHTPAPQAQQQHTRRGD